MVEIEIGTNEKGQRFDRFLRKYLPGAPLSYIYKIIRKDAKVNRRRVKDVYMLKEGDVVQLYIPDEEIDEFRKKEAARPGKRTFRVAYEDDHILIADKPAGLLTHGDKSEKSDHLTNQVQSYLIEKGDFDPSESKTFAPSPVNRIDRNTSGLVIFTKDYDTLKEFNQLIRDREKIRKIYLTILTGCLESELTLDEMMERDERSNTSRVVGKARDAADGDSSKSKRAVTHVKPLCHGKISGRDFTIAEVEIETGRTHQIRVQLSEAGLPIAGDPKYGRADVNKMLKEKFGLGHQLLTAARLEFDEIDEEPEISGKVIKARLPKVFASIKREIEESRK